MKKLLSFLMAIALMATLSVCAFASSPENVEAQIADQSITSSEITPRLIPTTVNVYLTKNSWTRLYSDTNWLTEIATIQNLAGRGNPGSIYVKVTKTVDGTESTVETSSAIAVGSSFATRELSTSWDRYTVYVKAVSQSGTYSIKYSD